LKKNAVKNLIGIVILAVIFASGCGEKYDPKLGQNPSSSEVSEATKRRDETIAIHTRAGGDWDKMTPEDKKRLVELSNGDEGMAKQGWPYLGSLKK